jgi:hypothetical protein
VAALGEKQSSFPPSIVFSFAACGNSFVGENMGGEVMPDDPLLVGRQDEYFPRQK